MCCCVTELEIAPEVKSPHPMVFSLESDEAAIGRERMLIVYGTSILKLVGIGEIFALLLMPYYNHENLWRIWKPVAVPG
jgi:hypothetical protein